MGKLTSKQLQKIIMIMNIEKNYLCCENVKFLFDKSEHDVLWLTWTWRLIEYEIKTSKEDFKNDMKKRKMWKFKKLSEFKSSYYIQTTTPNYFYYVCQEWLIPIDTIPVWAWLIYISPETYQTTIIKKSPLLHSHLHKQDMIKDKFIRVLSQRSVYGWITKVTFDRSKKSLRELF